ncbi:membrane protein [Spirochaetia bacterium]|nr:membrane protein [Spirochaetia bacterium]
MRQGSFKAVFLILLVFTAIFSAFGDEATVNPEAMLLEAFDGSTTHEWVAEGRNRTYEFEWRADASKFATKNDEGNFPRLTYVPSFPQALFGKNPQGLELKSLGIWGKFDRKGYNWIDVYPVPAGGDGTEPFEIPLPGRVQYLDMWVWGSNLNFYIDAYVRDYRGVVHSFRLGDINYTGWRDLRANIPHNIPQSKRILPHYAGLTFVKFRITTQPIERVDNFYIYFDHFKILTDTFESLYDGDELGDPETVQEFWSASSNN